MATQFNRQAFVPAGFRSDLALLKAVGTAVAAERAASGSDRNPRRRICRFLCELAGALDLDGQLARLPLGRNQIADAMEISLVRVKRALGLLQLSGVVACEGDALRVLDWRRLCSAANVAVRVEDEDAELEDDGAPLAWFAKPATDMERRLITGAGDQAYFG